MGDLHGALALAHHALDARPRDAQLHYAMAVCLEELKRHEEALASYDATIEIAPAHEDALHNRGLLLAQMGRLDEAEENHQRYVARLPGSPRALSDLVDVWIALGRLDDASAGLRRLAAVAPDDVGVPIREGVVLASRRDYRGAAARFADARKKDAGAVLRYVQRVAPGADPETMLSPRNIYLGRCWNALGNCDWTEWERFTSEMREAAADRHALLEPAVGFMCRLLPLTGYERMLVCQKIAARIESRTLPLAPLPMPRRKARLRVGVLSPDFREHLNAYLLRPFFELLDRSRFEVHGYSLCPDDGSAIRAATRSAADGFRDLYALSDLDAARAIRHDDIDILLDVGGHTTGARFAITAQRPARIQVNYLGFSCSLASKRVDYAIVDRHVGSDDAEWTEARVFLPSTHFLYDFRSPAPAPQVTRSEYGLPDNAFVYCAFHQAHKISPDVFELWMRILSQVPRSVLWFRAISDNAVRNLSARAAAHGIDPQRLKFAPFEAAHDPRYLARHRLGNLMLDALHHNAMTSACDALGMGLPLLTVSGTAMTGRAGASILHAAGLHELIASNYDDYVQAAVRLGTDPVAARELKERCLHLRGTAPLFDTTARIRALESALSAMYERAARGDPPAPFGV